MRWCKILSTDPSSCRHFKRKQGFQTLNQITLPHLTHLDVFSYQKEALKLLRDDCLLQACINQLTFTQKALKKCRRWPPFPPHHLSGSIPSCHTPMKPSRHFHPQSQPLKSSHSLIRSTGINHSWHLSPDEPFVKYFESCPFQSKAYFWGEIPTGIWQKSFATAVSHRCDHQKIPYSRRNGLRTHKLCRGTFLNECSSTVFLWAWFPFPFVELF